MPHLVAPVLPPGRLSGSPQPSLRADGGLLLRPWSEADAPRLVEIFRDPAIRRWHLRRADSEEEARRWVAEWRRAWRAERGAHWAVVTDPPNAAAGKHDPEHREGDAGGTVVGRVALQGIIPMGGQAELAYWTAPAARGGGVARRAVGAVTAWAFGEAGFHRLELGHSTANPASCRVAAAAGYLLEGVRRRALLHTDGWHDMHLHARLSEDPPPGGSGKSGKAPADRV
ncbi:GNAT family N-acetyltransferase [Streptomyces calidiresistens]|uniref:GNAT family N-acetyltransferase n=1 Tax=Streptomyces calidiresistens TaxID=1485586 RepID=A0A7W3T220_9ACTN|nr:GNAT family N-acetyltransferase [Streptomyces calidiresistens]MBB0229181.1 GNAT family N-acetyltransferase [Streptomyces calidiresistens]